jgi:cobalt-zinc-cadmium efflux system protein
MHAHAHAHDHHHDHHHRPGAAALGDKRYTIAIALNLGFVAMEVAAGFIANSTALLADAAHNLSDVLGLALAGGATLLARRAASDQRTYGYSKATVLAALANALVLVAACGGILFEALQRLTAPTTLQPLLVMVMAAGGVIINGATALLFVADRKDDVNVRGAFIHMLGDAGISAGVIIAGAFIWWTHATWIDPLASLIIVGVIFWSTWGLLRESLDLAMDAAPAHINVNAVRDYLAKQEGVTAVHDLHIWAMGAAAPALTAHLVRPAGSDDAFLGKLTESIALEFGIHHVTLQIERAQRNDCAEC